MFGQFNCLWNLNEHSCESTMFIWFPKGVCMPLTIRCRGMLQGIENVCNVYSGNATNIYKTKQYINVNRELKGSVR